MNDQDSIETGKPKGLPEPGAFRQLEDLFLQEWEAKCRAGKVSPLSSTEVMLLDIFAQWLDDQAGRWTGYLE